MRVPVWALRSKPQTLIVTARKEAAPTGQPWCQLLPSSAVVTVRLFHRNATAREVVCWTGFVTLRVGVGLRTGMDVVATGDAAVVDGVDVGVGAATGLAVSL